MLYYPCPKCNIIFNKKSNLTRHINKKFDCSLKTKSSNDNEFTEINKISQKLTKINKISQKLTKLNTNSNESENILKIPNTFNTQSSEFVDLNETTFCCSYCGKKLVNKYSLLRHIDESCKVKKANDEEKENTFKMLLERDKQRENEINQLKKQNELFEKQNKILMDKIDKLINIKSNPKSSKTINNNQKITNNIQNNNNTQNNQIIMVNFGKEDLSIIDEKLFIDRIVKKPLLSGVKIPDEVLKLIHFNDMYPQLSNIYISDINRDKCMVFEDNEWKLSNIDNIPQIMDKICIFSTDQINIIRDKYPNNKPLNDRLNTIEKYNNMIDNDYLEDLKDDEDNQNKVLIKRCKDFQKLTYSTLKKTLYNEGKKIKKTIKTSH